MIIEKIADKKSKDIKQYPCNVNRASELGHPCVRYLVFCRTNWQDKKLHDANLQFIFDLGNDIEKRVLADLTDAGVAVIEQQRSFDWKEHSITGHIDAKILIDGRTYPVEIKSMSPYTFEAVNSLDDLKNGKYVYLRKYPAQMMIYLLLSCSDKGIFIFKNKTNGQMKEIWVDLDYQLGEELIQKAEKINKHIKEGTNAEPMEWDDRICGECPFLHICLPDRKPAELEIRNDEEIESLLNRYYELKPLAKEYEDVDNSLKEKLKGIVAVIGNYIVEGKWMERKSYPVPEEIKKQYEQITKYWKRTVKYIGEG